MMREEPLFRKCCFILPLRLCLQIWAYIKMVLDVLALGYLLFSLAMLFFFDPSVFIRALSMVHLMVLLAISLIADLGFLIILLRGIYKKSVANLRVFYFYEMYVMAVETVIVTVCVFRTDTSQGVFDVMFGFLYILLDLSIIMTVKSEMIKLRNKEQYDFSKMPVYDDVEGTNLLADEK